MNAWQVCVEHQHAHAGLYRGVRDFASALNSGVLSFDGQCIGEVSGPGGPVVQRVGTGEGWLARRVLALNEGAVREADAIVACADLLVVHSLFRAHAPWGRNWAVRHQKSYWIVPHGCLDPVGLARRRISKRLWLSWYGSALFADAAVVVFATNRERDKARASGRQVFGRVSDERGPRSTVVHWPVALPSLSGVSCARAAFRSRRGIPQSSPILLCVGRLHATKRLERVIRAFVVADVREAHLVVVGMEENVTRATLQSQVPSGFAQRVHVIGALHGQSLEEAWLAADGYISLSAKENFGYTAADALAHGLPVILSMGHDLAYDLPRTSNGRLSCGWHLADDSMQSAVQAVREWGDLVKRPNATRRQLASVQETSRTWAADNLSFSRFQSSLQALAGQTL